MFNYTKEYNNYWSRGDRWGQSSFNNPSVIVDQILCTCGLGKLLDVGCGMGLLVRSLISRGVDAYGIDIAKAPIEEANRLIPGHYHAGSILKIPYPENSFEIISSTDCLEHLIEDDIQIAISELYRVTKRFAYIRLSTSVDRDNKWHKTVHNREWWENKFISCGFKKHTLLFDIVNYPSLENEKGTITILLEKIPPKALKKYPWKSLAKERDLHMDMLREAGRRSEAHCARYALVKRVVRENDIVLDAGCGLGYGSAIIWDSTICSKVIGIDESSYAINYAKSNFVPDRKNLLFAKGDIIELSGVESNSIDVVVAFEILEHIKKPDRFLKQVERVLVPGGRFICSVPNLWVDKTGRDPNPFHLQVFDYDKLINLCKKHLIIEKVYSQVAGGGMTLGNRPRKLEEVNLTEDNSKEEAEWWLLTGMKTPLEGEKVKYHETSCPNVSGEDINAISFGRDYDNPWLLRSLIHAGWRVQSNKELVTLAKKVIETADKISPDFGGALCVLAYRFLDDKNPDKKHEKRLLEKLKSYIDAVIKTARSGKVNPHSWRWAISNQYVLARILQNFGDFESARQEYIKCAGMDFAPFSPLIATKTVDAAFIAGWMCFQNNDFKSAKKLWQQGVDIAKKAMQGDWKEIIGSPEKPLEFGMREITQVADLATRCANGLYYMDQLKSRPGKSTALIFSSTAENYSKENRYLKENYNQIISETGRHINNLENVVKERNNQLSSLEPIIKGKDEHINNLEVLLREKNQHIANLEPVLKDKDKHISNIEKALKQKDAHIANLEPILREKDKHIANIEKVLKQKDGHIANLEPILKEKDKHIANIEKVLKQKDGHIANLEPVLKDKDKHINNIEKALKQKDAHIANLELATKEQVVHVDNLESLLKERNDQIDYLGIDLQNKGAIIDTLEDLVSDKEAAIAQYRDSLEEADATIAELKIALTTANEHARGLEINVLDNQQKIAGLADGIKIRDKHISNLTDELNRYRQHASNLEGKAAYLQNHINELEDNLYNSLGGKVLLFYRNLKNKIAPPSTWRRSGYEWCLRRIKGLFKTGKQEYHQNPSDAITRFRRLKELMMPAGSLRRVIYEKIIRVIKAILRMGAEQPIGETVLIKYRLIRDKLFPRGSWRRAIYALIVKIIKAPLSVLLVITIWIIMGLRKITPNWIIGDAGKKEELRYVTSLKKVTHYNRNEVETINASVAIAIPTFNAGESFSTTLALWKNQKGIKKLTIRIVDSGSKDNTVEYAREIGAEMEIIDSKDFHHAKVRNRIANKSDSEYVLFTVQDATPQNQFLIYDLVNFVRQNKLIAASARQVPRLNIDLFAGWQQAYHINWLFPKPESRISKITPEQFKKLPPEKQRLLASLDDVCALVKRDAFLEMGSYDNAIFFGEDIDFGKRCLENNKNIGLLYDNGVIHSHVRPLHYFLKRDVVSTFYANKIFGMCRNKPTDIKELSLFISQAELLYGSVSNHFRHCQSYARFCNLLQELTPSTLVCDDETTGLIKSLCQKFGVVSIPVSQNELTMFAGLVRAVTKYLEAHSAQMDENPAAVQEFMRKFASMYIGQRIAQCLDADTTNEKIVDLVGGGV